MKKIFLTAALVIGALTFVKSQENTQLNKRFIEITGMAESEITPDEIFITITLQERNENREKLSIQKQEDELKKNVKELGIDLSNLTLNSADGDYGKLRRSTKDLLITKTYILKVSNADMVNKVYARLDKINVFDAYISNYTYSKIVEFTKENRIKAIKAAKEKADYTLAAIGQQAGQPLQISEVENYVVQPMYAMKRNMLSNSAEDYDKSSEEGIDFKKIKIKSSFLVKYEIINK